MHKQPLVSIITVCFNSEKTIRCTFESVLNQNYTNIEYIVIDGLSTDGTLEIIKEYEIKFQGKMRWISEKDNGIYDAMNKGIKVSRGELIGIINSDDWYERNAVNEIVNKYNPNIKYQVIYGLLRKINKGHEYQISFNNHLFLKENMINHPSCFISNDTYKDLGMYSSQYKVSADYELMLRLNEKGVTFIPVYEIISNFALGGASSSQRGVMETAGIKYKYKIIKLRKFLFIILLSRMSLLKRKLIKIFN